MFAYMFVRRVNVTRESNPAEVKKRKGAACTERDQSVGGPRLVLALGTWHLAPFCPLQCSAIPPATSCSCFAHAVLCRAEISRRYGVVGTWYISLRNRLRSVRVGYPDSLPSLLATSGWHHFSVVRCGDSPVPCGQLLNPAWHCRGAWRFPHLGFPCMRRIKSMKILG